MRALSGHSVRAGRPETIIRLDSGQRRFEPRAVGCFAVDAQDHAGQKGRLRAGQVIGAVRVQNRAVVLDFVHEVVDHVARGSYLVILEQPDLDEITVPAVHLVEAATRDDIRAGQVQETVLLDCRQIGGKRLQFDGGELFLTQNLPDLARHAVAIFAA